MTETQTDGVYRLSEKWSHYRINLSSLKVLDFSEDGDNTKVGRARQPIIMTIFSEN